MRENQYQQSKEREFHELLEASLHGREPLEAICIDDPKVKIPEDSITVTENRDGSFFVRASFPDISILDPQADSLRTMMEKLRASPDKPISGGGGSKFKKQLIFKENQELPCFTIQGNFRADRGITAIEVVKTRVKADMFTYNDIETLRNDSRYKNAEDFAYSFAKYQSKVGTNSRFVTEPKKVLTVHPASVVEQTMIFANTSAGIFINSANNSSIYRTFDRSKQTSASVSHEPGWHEGLNTETYVEISNSLRRLSSWVCSLTVLKTIENGEPPLTREDFRLVTEALSA